MNFEDSFYNSLKNDLTQNILPYWEKYACDTKKSCTGFFGKIDNDNSQDEKVSRSIVMTSRFLWAYSASARFLNDEHYLKMADFAYTVILEKYFDKKNDGVFWSVNPDGTPAVSKKQIYGEAFCCYGLSEYAAAIKEIRGDEKNAKVAMQKALNLFNLIENFALDKKDGGYIEACAENWQATDDMRLSAKDMNCAKSMNTNLHVMEAYTNLFRTLPLVMPENFDERKKVGSSLANLVQVTIEKILQPNAHLALFFNMDWSRLDDEISYGHDIEASWLLWEAVTELGDINLCEKAKPFVLKIAEVSLDEGFDKETGAFENCLKNGVRDRTRVWWNQAEAINGFYNAWEMTKKSEYADAVKKVWNWVLEKQIDKEHGEWWAEVDVNGNPNFSEPKGGNWKTAYHNGRCCLELLRRAKK